MRILAVEDDANVAASLELLLRASGMVAEVTATRIEALSRLRDDSFDMMLIDLSLPDMNGHELLAKARSTGATVPAVAMTGSVTAAPGFDSVLLKPFSHRELLAAIHWASSLPPRKVATG